MDASHDDDMSSLSHDLTTGRLADPGLEAHLGSSAHSWIPEEYWLPTGLPTNAMFWRRRKSSQLPTQRKTLAIRLDWSSALVIFKRLVDQEPRAMSVRTANPAPVISPGSEDAESCDSFVFPPNPSLHLNFRPLHILGASQRPDSCLRVVCRSDGAWGPCPQLKCPRMCCMRYFGTSTSAAEMRRTTESDVVKKTEHLLAFCNYRRLPVWAR